MEVAACQIHQVGRRETVQGQEGSRPEDQSGSDMDLLGHRGHQMEDRHPEEIDHVEGNSAVAGLDETVTVVPVTRVLSARVA